MKSAIVIIILLIAAACWVVTDKLNWDLLYLLICIPIAIKAWMVGEGARRTFIWKKIRDKDIKNEAENLYALSTIMELVTSSFSNDLQKSEIFFGDLLTILLSHV